MTTADGLKAAADAAVDADAVEVAVAEADVVQANANGDAASGTPSDTEGHEPEVSEPLQVPMLRELIATVSSSCAAERRTRAGERCDDAMRRDESESENLFCSKRNHITVYESTYCMYYITYIVPKSSQLTTTQYWPATSRCPLDSTTSAVQCSAQFSSRCSLAGASRVRRAQVFAVFFSPATAAACANAKWA